MVVPHARTLTSAAAPISYHRHPPLLAATAAEGVAPTNSATALPPGDEYEEIREQVRLHIIMSNEQNQLISTHEMTNQGTKHAHAPITELDSCIVPSTKLPNISSSMLRQRLFRLECLGSFVHEASFEANSFN